MPLFMRQHYKLFEEKYGESLEYLLSSPPGYAPGTGAGPVLCFLQGIGEHAPMAPLGQWTQRKHLIAIPTVGFGYLWVHTPDPPKGKLLNFISILGDQPAANYLNGNFLSIDRGKDHMGTARLAYQDDQVYNWLLAGWVTSDQDGTDYDCAGLFSLDKPCYISLDSHSQTRKAYFGHEFVKHIPRQSLTLWCKSQESFAPFQVNCTHFHMNNARPPLDRLGYLEESEDG